MTTAARPCLQIVQVSAWHAGECRARDRLFIAQGWLPCIVPEAEWQNLRTPQQQQECLLARLQDLPGRW